MTLFAVPTDFMYLNIPFFVCVICVCVCVCINKVRFINVFRSQYACYSERGMWSAGAQRNERVRFASEN